jgi:hypothetical protein
MPGPQDNPNDRYWASPRIGDIVDCRFPDFLGDEPGGEHVTKTRPCLVVGLEAFVNGQVIARIAYGTSRGGNLGYKDHPGEILIESSYRKAGLPADTKFSLRKVIDLPFNNTYFPPHPKSLYGLSPKRGWIDMGNVKIAKMVETAAAEAERLGSLIEQVNGQVRLRKP